MFEGFEGHGFGIQARGAALLVNGGVLKVNFCAFTIAQFVPAAQRDKSVDKYNP